MIGSDDDLVIVTSRLELRPLAVDDADEMAIVLADPALHQFTGGEPATLDELRRRFAAWVQGSGSVDELWLNWIVGRTEDAVAVGTMQATVMNPATAAATEAYVAWTIGTPWQGQGYAGEAATALVRWLVDHGIVSIVALVHADHVASAGVAARAGLRSTPEFVDGEVVWRLN